MLSNYPKVETLGYVENGNIEIVGNVEPTILQRLKPWDMLKLGILKSWKMLSQQCSED